MTETVESPKKVYLLEELGWMDEDYGVVAVTFFEESAKKWNEQNPEGDRKYGGSYYRTREVPIFD